MSDSTASAVPSPGPMPGVVKALAAGFFLVCLAIQVWRLESLSATYDQALFLQELWSTAQGRPFESSLSSVLSAAVKVDGELPSVTYLHLGQHANFLTLLIAPLVALLGSWALPLVQVGVLTAAGLVLWRIAARRLPASLAIRITAAYYLSGAVIGPALENFHDLIWLPLLGFLVVEALLEQRRRQLVLAAVMLLLVREDSGLVLFSWSPWASFGATFLLIALVSQGRSALSVTLRYVLALVPGLYLGSVLWWQRHPLLWSRRWIRRCWVGALALGLTLTLVANPHRSLSALVPDSFSPWVHVSPAAMLERRAALREAVALIPDQASVSADTPVLPSLAQREVLIRFPKSTHYLDRSGEPQSVDWVVAFPGHYAPLAPVFELERNQQRSIRRELTRRVESGDYRVVHCRAGTVVLQRASAEITASAEAAIEPRPCSWLN